MAKTLPVAANVRITIPQVGADLHVRGWTRNEIQIDGDLPTMRADAETDAQSVTITAGGDCELFVPEGARLEIGSIGADLKVTEVNGDITVSSIGADASFRAIGGLTLGTVGADIRVRQTRGNVHIDNVGADATLHEVSGSVTIGQIGADAYIRTVEGDCVIEQVGADLVLDTAYLPGHIYRCNARADVICRIAPGANVRFVIRPKGDLAVNALNAVASEADGARVVTFGAGAAVVNLTADGDVRIVDERSFDPSFGIDFAFDFAFDRAFEESARVAERMGSRIRRQAERAAEQVRRQAERAAEKAQREAERMQHKTERGARFEWQWNGPGSGNNNGGNWGSWSAGGFRPPRPPEPPEPPRPPSEPVTDTERLTILKMVEAKQITVNEAERLLAALEGRA
jgi:hypothetical protein